MFKALQLVLLMCCGCSLDIKANASPKPTISVTPTWVGGWAAHYGEAASDELGLMIRDLGAFVETPIPQSWLDSFEGKLAAQPANKIILRFKYRDKTGPEPSKDLVITHIRQLAPILQKHHDKIVVLQAGFLGDYGEWWESDLLIFKHEIFDELAQAFGGIIAVRTPMIREELLPWFSSKLRERVAIHNDCFLASRGNAGTYALPVEAWQDAPSVFRGGETCRLSLFTDCENAVNEIQRQKVHYMNRTYHMDVINRWKADGCYEIIGKYLKTGAI